MKLEGYMYVSNYFWLEMTGFKKMCIKNDRGCEVKLDQNLPKKNVEGLS